MNTRILLLLLILSACTGKPSSLSGEWSNTYLHISLNKGDSVVNRDADSTNWEQVLGIKPIYTLFREDGTYRSEYRNLKDSVIRVAEGTWNVTGDTLAMSQSKPEASSYRMHMTLKEGKVIFEGNVDFDGDGTLDHYVGWQKRLR
ncbi:MAG: hypothetical protein JST46_11110 [Bacteroidetes bacterium]|nr:hypothetical protein [Bacteroidota bacterium]